MTKKQNLSNNLVVKSNDLVMAFYAMSVNEQRIFLSCLSQMDSREILERDALFTLSVEQARDLFYTRGDQRNAYRDLKQASRRLFERKVRIDLGDGQELLTRFVQTVKFNDKTEEVQLRFAHDLIPYLSQQQRNFSQYRLSNVVQLTSSYAIRIYEIIVAWAGQGVLFKEMEVDEFRNMLALDGKYRLLGQLKARVIEPALEQINEYTDFELNISFRKVRRTFKWIQLRFNRKEEAVRIDADAKAARLERQVHNAEAKEKRIEAEQKQIKAAAEKAQAAAISAFFAEIKHGSIFIDEEGKEWEFDGSWLNSVSGRSVIILDAAYQAIQNGQLRLLSPLSDDQKERERLEAQGQQRLFSRKEKK